MSPAQCFLSTLPKGIETNANEKSHCSTARSGTRKKSINRERERKWRTESKYYRQCRGKNMNVLKNLVNFWLARCVRVALWQSEKPHIFKTMNEGAGTERDLKIAEIHILKGAMKFI